MNRKLSKALKMEAERQENNIELIASENYVSKDILKLQGSILTNKYAEGYPGKKYYGGCEYIDVIENLAIDYACKLFKCVSSAYLSDKIIDFLRTILFISLPSTITFKSSTNLTFAS